MKKFKRILPLINLILPFIFLLLILFTDNSSEKIYYIIFLTGIVGWTFPLFTVFTTGVVQIRKVHPKIALILNIVSILLNCFILYFIIRLIDKSLIIMLIIYCITFILTIINIVYLIDYNKKNISPERIQAKEENKRIKKIKKENNGVIK